MVLSYVKQQAASALQKITVLLWKCRFKKLMEMGAPSDGLLIKRIIIQVTVLFCFVLFFIPMPSFNKPPTEINKPVFFLSLSLFFFFPIIFFIFFNFALDKHIVQCS